MTGATAGVPPALSLVSGGHLTEPEHDTENDHDDDDEAVGAPVSLETESERDEAEEHEEAAHEAAQGATDDSGIERAFTSLAKEATRHANRISQIMGGDAQLLQPCPRCVTSDPQRPATPGFVWPHEMVPLLPEDKAKVKLSIGEGGEAEYKSNDDAFVCAKCAGHGKYPTGSFVSAQRFIACDLCEGRGWIGQRSINAQAVSPNGPPQGVLVGSTGEEPTPESDPWGRVKGDPNYGVLPGFEG